MQDQHLNIMELKKKYYIAHRNGEYVSHGENVLIKQDDGTFKARHLRTNAEVVPFDDEEEFNIALEKYDIPEDEI